MIIAQALATAVTASFLCQGGSLWIDEPDGWLQIKLEGASHQAPEDGPPPGPQPQPLNHQLSQDASGTWSWNEGRVLFAPSAATGSKVPAAPQGPQGTRSRAGPKSARAHFWQQTSPDEIVISADRFVSVCHRQRGCRVEAELPRKPTAVIAHDGQTLIRYESTGTVALIDAEEESPKNLG